MEFEMQATFALTAVNVILLLLLTYLHSSNYARFKSNFTLGLLAVNLAFLAQYATSLYFYLTNMAYYVDMVSLHVFVLTALQTIAFSVQTAVSWT